MRFPITVIMESAVFSVILKDDILLISKCYWLVLVLISGISLWQRVLSCFCVLLSLHSPPNGKKGTEWVLPSFFSAERFNEGKHCTLWNAHQNSLHCRVQGERKESWRSEDSLGSHWIEKGKTCTLWNAHQNSLHCNLQGERKENEGGKCFEIFLGSLSDSIFAWIASVLDANYWTLERMQ